MSLVPPHIASIRPYVPGKPMAELEEQWKKVLSTPASSTSAPR